MKRMMLALALASALMAWPSQSEVCVTEASHGEVTIKESEWMLVWLSVPGLYFWIRWRKDAKKAAEK